MIGQPADYTASMPGKLLARLRLRPTRPVHRTATVRERILRLFATSAPSRSRFGVRGRRTLALAVALLLAACSKSGSDTPAPAPIPDQPSGTASVIQVADPQVASQLLKGFHGVEQGSWRWTEKEFSVSLKPPAPGKPATLQLKLSLPEVLLKRLQSVTLKAVVNGVALPSETYTQPGAHVYAQSVPANALTGESVRVDFTLDKALGPDESDRRQLGVVVSSVALE